MKSKYIIDYFNKIINNIRSMCENNLDQNKNFMSVVNDFHLIMSLHDKVEKECIRSATSSQCIKAYAEFISAINNYNSNPNVSSKIETEGKLTYID